MLRVHLSAAGVLFLALGFSKLHAPQQLRAYLVATHSLASENANALALAIAVGEIAIGAMALAAGLLQRRTTAAALVVLGVSLITVGYTLIVKAPVPCGCFGTISTATKAHRLFVGMTLVYLAASALVYARNGRSVHALDVPQQSPRST